MIVKCKPTDKTKEPCPMLRYCLARLADPTITGCGVPLHIAGVIRKADIYVEHAIRGSNEEPTRNKH